MMRCFWFRKAIGLVLCASILLTCFAIAPAAFAENQGTTNAKVVLRKSASKEARALQTVPKGEEVTILSTSGSWYKVRYGNFTGYMMQQYVDRANSSASSSGSSSTAAERIKALGNAPGMMRVGDENSDVKKLQQALNILGYYDGKIDGVYGSGTTAAVEAYQRAHKLEPDGYAGTETVTSIFGTCGKTSLTTQPEPGSAQSAVAVKSESKYPTVSSISEIGSAPATTREGDSGNNVVKLQQALECLGYYSGAIDGVYGEGTVAAVKKFQRKRNMKDDGIAGSSTIRVIFGTTASAGSSSTGSQKSIKTEVPDWFEDNVTSVIPKNARFTIKDVKTGKTFEAVRWSGVNHLDAEPRTAEDTATMKSIFGGSWSWSRRAILIKYNGHVYAASMNGMPHGTTTISNGFDGHFCIHFKNSKTHGTKRVDEDHQNAVTNASKAVW
ncbi:MAG: peptidoglycan-binding protein [Clostridiales bacterium]|nr:peptidoglycan-binding protein [Clostridiales bacterium]